MPAEMPSAQDRERFEELLPFYVTRQLSSEDAALVEAYLADNPAAASALAFTERVRQVVKSIGSDRDPEPALARLLAEISSVRRPGLIKRLHALLGSLGVSRPLVVALMLSAGLAIGYAAYKTQGFGLIKQSQTIVDQAHLSVTLKPGVEYGSAAIVIEQFGARVVHSATVEGAEKLLITIMDQTRIQALIDALMEAGLAEMVVILL